MGRPSKSVSFQSFHHIKNFRYGDSMDEVKRKVYLDLFASPWNLIPFAGGITALMASWATGGEPTLTMAGIAGVLGGIGVTASRLIWGLESLTEKAYSYQLDKKQKDQETRLDTLDDKLTRDRDPRTQTCLRELRVLKASLQSAAQKGNITTSSYEIMEGVNKVVDQCVNQLEHSHALWETARRMQGPTAESIMRQRDDIIKEVQQTVVDVGAMIDSYFLSESQRSRTELGKVRRELDESIEAARRAGERTEELERSVRAKVGD